MSIIQSITDFNSFLNVHYPFSLHKITERTERKILFTNFMNKYLENCNNIKVATVSRNGYSLINAFLAYLQYNGIMTNIEIEEYYHYIEKVILSLEQPEILEKIGENLFYHLDSDNNIEIEPVMLSLLNYFGKKIRVSIIQYKDGIGELNKIVFNEDCNDDHYIFLNKNSHFYAILLPKNIRISIKI